MKQAAAENAELPASALALYDVLLQRLDAEHAAAGRDLGRALTWLYGKHRMDGDDLLQDLAQADPRFERPLALMRQAFERDAAAAPGRRFARWSDLHNHLRFACVPAGQILLAVHGEAGIAQPALDALAIAIGLTALLQDAPRRFRSEGVVDLPVQWFPTGAPIEAILGSKRRQPAVDEAYRAGLARLDEMLTIVENGARAVHNDGLRRGMLAAHFVMRRLRSRLARRSPNRREIAISPLDRLLLRWRH